MVLALVVLLFLGGVFLALGVTSLSGKLRRNSVAGVRIPSTMASDAAWEAGHRAVAPLNIGLGVLGIFLALLVVIGWPPVVPEQIVLGYALCLLVASVPLVVIAGRAAKAAG